MSIPALRLLVGSYTARSGGTGAGISLLEIGAASGGAAAGGDASPPTRTLAELDDPSFLAVSGDRVYAVSETEDGTVHAFRSDGRSLEHLWAASTGGDAPCHVRVDPASGTLVVTNYTSGTVSAVGLEAAETRASTARASDALVPAGDEPAGGALTTVSDAVATEILPDVEGPVVDRQEGPHAHQSVPGAAGDTVLVADLGGDALHEFRLSVADDGVPAFERVRVHHVAPGVGPRHLAWLDGDLIVAGELDGRVHRLRPDDDGSLREVASAPTTDGSDGKLFLSHLDVDAYGRVYVAVRGQDTVVVLDGRDGGLAFVAAVPCGGVWPRHFLLADGHVLVANQFSDTVTVLPLDDAGVPGGVVAEFAVGSPACLVRID